MGFKISVDGVQQLLTAIDKGQIKLMDESRNTLINVGAFMEGEVKESIAGRRGEPTSVDTGRFLNSVSHRVEEDAVLIYSDVDYGVYLEYGTTKIAPRRHFNNSMDRNREAVKKMFADAVKSAVD